MTEKTKDRKGNVSGHILLGILFAIALPFLLLCALVYVLTTPFDYIRQKRSRYQKDFPYKYRWLDAHPDSLPYAAIKENDLPIEYIKWSEDSGTLGYFVYRDLLLNFSECLFFDEEKREWSLFLDCEEEGEGDTPAPEVAQDTEERLSVDEAKSFLLEAFHRTVPDRVCRDVVFFYTQRRADAYKGALEKMREEGSFVIYRKKELARVLEDFVRTH